MNKYHNRKILVDGICFDSVAEAQYYEVLKQKQVQGEVKSFLRQPKLILQEQFTKQGEKFRAITYTPDFLVVYSNGYQEYVDVKGISTKEGELKRKLYFYHYDLPLKWLLKNAKYCTDGTGFVDYFEYRKIKRKEKKSEQARATSNG